MHRYGLVNYIYYISTLSNTILDMRMNFSNIQTITPIEYQSSHRTLCSNSMELKKQLLCIAKLLSDHRKMKTVYY